MTGLGLASPSPWAAEYPDRQIRLIVPNAPGGPADSVSRLLGDRLSASLGQPVIIFDRPGATGNIGLGEAARSPADGYTLAQAATANLAINPWMYKNLPFDADKDFTPVALFASTANILFVAPDLPATDLNGLIALAKAKPGQLNGGYPGPGNSSAIALALLRKAAGIDVAGVSYAGDVQAITALISGQIQMLFSVSQSAAQMVQSGKLRALAVAGPQRSVALPNVPTFEEAGLKGFFDTTAFFILVTNSGVPRPVVVRLHNEITRIVETPEFRSRLAQFGMAPMSRNLEDIDGFVKAERARWGVAVRESGAKIE